MFCNKDMASVQVDGGELEMVVALHTWGLTNKEMKTSLMVAICNNSNMLIATKRAAYKAVALAELLHESEDWVLKAQQARRLNVFHNHCARTILIKVTRYQQWQEGLTTQAPTKRYGMLQTIPDIILE